jgi:hypothetical protein
MWNSGNQEEIQGKSVVAHQPKQASGSGIAAFLSS